MKKALKRTFLLIVMLSLIIAIVFLLIRLTPEPPVDVIDKARESLSEAESNKASTYSKKLYNDARVAFDSAMNAWKRENDRFIFFRNFDEVSEYADLAYRKARQASESSVTSSNSLRIRLKTKIDTLDNTAQSIDRLFGRYPLQAEIRNRISRGKMLLSEGRVAYEKGQYLTANRKITDAEYLLEGVYGNALEELKRYFDSWPKWKRWSQNTINESKRSNSYTVIVDKFSKKCYLYLGGVKRYEFDAELGRNWVGDKRQSGDKATPEGTYRIVRKYQGRETLYHKALSLDYPNDEDRESFRREITRGTLPASARIGGGIELHGGGGKGVDWTEGCIALTNTEIDLVYSILKVGTQVTIVGSMKPIEEILKN